MFAVDGMMMSVDTAVGDLRAGAEGLVVEGVGVAVLA